MAEPTGATDRLSRNHRLHPAGGLKTSSKVTFEIEPAGPVVRLTVIHDGFEANSEMLKGVSEDWPTILSHLKTLLEVEEPSPSPAAA